MNEVSFQNIITSNFSQLWNDECPVEYPNGPKIDTQKVSEWARFSIQPYRPFRYSLGKAALRMGCITIQLFTKPGLGSSRAVSLAQQVGEIFKNLNIVGIVFDPYQLVDLGESLTSGLNTTETNWYQTNAIIDYKFFD